MKKYTGINMTNEYKEIKINGMAMLEYSEKYNVEKIKMPEITFITVCFSIR